MNSTEHELEIVALKADEARAPSKSAFDNRKSKVISAMDDVISQVSDVSLLFLTFVLTMVVGTRGCLQSILAATKGVSLDSFGPRIRYHSHSSCKDASWHLFME